MDNTNGNCVCSNIGVSGPMYTLSFMNTCGSCTKYHVAGLEHLVKYPSSPTIARGGDSIDLVDAAATGIKILMVQIRCWSLDSRLYSCLIFWLLPCRIVHITMFPFVYYRICGILIPVAAASTRSIESPPLAIVGDEVLEEISCILVQWRSHVINNFMALRPHFGLGAWLQSCKLRHAPRVSFRNCCERGRSAC